MPDSIAGRLHDMISDNAGLVTALSVLSMVLLAASIFVTPWLIARLPSDYFSAPSPPPTTLSAGSLLLGALSNALGLLLIIAGIVMLVAPGPGLLVMLIGLALCRFPGRHRLLCRLAGHPRVFDSLNWIRRQRNREAFIAPDAG